MKTLKNRILAIFAAALILVLGVGSFVLAGSIDFTIDLPMFSSVANVVNWQVKQTNINGSMVSLNTAVSNSDTVFLYTDLSFQNGGQTVQFSPPAEFSTTTNAAQWLGAYVQYQSSPGDSIRLMGYTPRWNGDRITGNWNYY